MSVLAEETSTQATLDRVEEIEDVAMTFPADDPRRERLLRVARAELAATAPVRPRTAAALLGLNEKTVRAWVAEGVLTAATTSPRLLLDPATLHEVWHVVRDLREAGTTHGLLDEVYRRLSDAALLARDDLKASLAQMARDEGRVVVPRRAG
jgi:DNA-binding transcriptional MerR regulator